MYREAVTTSVSKKSPEVVLIGVSAAMQDLRTKIDRIASNQSPVMILGETGTGKEVVARKVHEASGLRRFVPIDCSVLVGPLMESELFGYIKGAFTGADSTRSGLLEEAHLGTAFFDEIAELPLTLQVKLLRVLQEREFRPLGATTTKYVECRVLAATNRNITEEVRRGRFRQDLYYRLNVITLRIPPLRERREDIPVLSSFFLQRYGQGLECATDVEDILYHYDWPGNVRELENSIQRMTAVCNTSTLRFVDLPSPIVNSLRNPQRFVMAQASSVAASNSVIGHASGAVHSVPGGDSFASDGSQPGRLSPFGSVGNTGFAANDPNARDLQNLAHSAAGPSVPYPSVSTSQAMRSAHGGSPVSRDFPHVLPLSEVERRAILTAIHATHGDRTLAAQLLGIGRTTLYRKLKSYGVDV